MSLSDIRLSSPRIPCSDCDLCPRLAALRETNRARWPSWHNAPVNCFGGHDAWLLIVGLAPGLRGANRTGRPFTGDAAGEILYDCLRKYGWLQGEYAARIDDGLILKGVAIVNAVRCVPPQNKPTGEEIRNCNQFLQSQIAKMSNLRAILALGRIAHTAIIKLYDLRQIAYPFGHAHTHRINKDVRLYDSYHCSRYNINTGRLTPHAFAQIFAILQKDLGRQTRQS